MNKEQLSTTTGGESTHSLYSRIVQKLGVRSDGRLDSEAVEGELLDLVDDLMADLRILAINLGIIATDTRDISVYELINEIGSKGEGLIDRSRIPLVVSAVLEGLGQSTLTLLPPRSQREIGASLRRYGFEEQDIRNVHSKA